MDIQTFYQTYLGEHELVRASLFNAANFTTNEALIKYKLEELESQTALHEMFEHLSMAEAKLLRRLSTEASHDNVHRVSYLPGKYPTLIDYQFILEDNGTEADRVERVLHGPGPGRGRRHPGHLRPHRLRHRP